ncbi:mannonate dehydratase [Bauldia litoralis]|uniref:Mannonate dehydratase n=2 Tax=Bauldia litoralis TaxID=665467 RepID=A0A1G6AHA4_9HYPH|nr:mannonate dehydratase [Bauldia litoralis]SDB07739.1 mannonate dehydratase [Bauldia litoralis]
MEKTWRWFGPKDPIPLAHVREAGATGIVTALHQIPGGTAWDDAAIAERKGLIEAAGLRWSVVESIPVTNAIKARTDEWRHDVDAWKDTLRALGRAGMDTVCYNFMPIVDWTRTDLAWPLKSGLALRFDIVDFAAYDVFVLQRDDAGDDYEAATLADAEARFATMPDARKEELERIILAGLPGSDFAYDRAKFLDLLKVYDRMGRDELLQSLTEFLEEVVPVAEENGIRLGIHPDDPPFPLFGLPRIVSTESDIGTLLDAYDSPSNGLTFCVGSYGSRGDNDLNEMIRAFAPRINFLHFRNVTIDAPGVFYEDEHLAGRADMVSLSAAILDEEDRRREEGRTDTAIPMRPDHGHLLAGDPVRNANPGYSYVGRLKGLAELSGIIHTLTAIRQ